MKRLGWLMLMLAGCTEVSGHRNLHRWSSTGTSKHPDVGSVRIGAWAEDGGFLQLTTEDLGEGQFRCKDVPAGEYFVGITDPTGREIQTWIHTDSRVLDLDQIADFDFGENDAGVIAGTTTVAPVRMGGVEGFDRLVVFSPETSSSSTSGVSSDGGLRLSLVFSGFPASNPDAVRSWIWQNTSTFERDDAGISRTVTSIGGWTSLTGLPSAGELPLAFSLDQERTVSVQLPVDAFNQLVPVMAPTVRTSYAVLGVNVTPRFTALPERSMSLSPSVGLVFNQGPLAELASFSSFTLTTHNPLPAPEFQELWSWSLSVGTGMPGQRAGTVSYSVGSTSPPTSFEVKVKPPTALTIDGFDATQSRAFASTSPVVSWHAPETGTPVGYFVEFVDESSAVLQRLLTKSTSVHLPPGFVSGAPAGSIRVRALISPKLAWEPQPLLDFPMEFTSAGIISARWTPAP